MADPPELWTFVAANLIVFGFGSLLTALSFIAYYSRSTSRTFRDATIGFGLITFGGVVEPVYQLGLKGDYHLAGRELLALQTAEGILMALGLGMLFYSIKGYNSASRRSASITNSETNDSP